MKKLLSYLMIFAIAIITPQFDLSILFGEKKPVYSGTQSLKKELEQITVEFFSVGDARLGSCSGTIINEVKGNHHVLTAKHCIHRTEEFYVDHKKARLIITSTTDDLAYVIVDGMIKNKKVAVLSKYTAYLDQEIHHLGYPEGHQYLSSGVVYRKTDRDHFAYLNSRGGCSGGGIFNNQSELTGVLWGGFDTYKEEIVLYEPTSDIRDFLEDISELLDIEYSEKVNTFKNIPDPIEEKTEKEIEEN